MAGAGRRIASDPGKSPTLGADRASLSGTTAADWSDEQAREHLLSAVRHEMYSSLELFYTHVKHTLSLLFALITTVSVMIGFAAKTGAANKHLLELAKVGSTAVLLLALPFGVVSMIITGRYYKLYVAALSYAAELHAKEGLGGHQWFKDLERDRKKLGPGATTERLIAWRAYGWPHSWLLYAIIIGLVAISSAAFGILVAASL